ncbi:MAG: hypothetical protein HY293_19375 [Planctomycetes bacterium]|nr:hypothetical protein [Planctomycetota bacterium]
MHDPERPKTPELVDGPCGHVYLDGKYLGRFEQPCQEAEEFLFKLTGRRVKLPRPKIDPRDRWPLGDDVLRVGLVGDASSSRARRTGAEKKPGRGSCKWS